MQTLYLFCSYVKWEGSRLTHGIFPCVGYTKLLERHLEDKNISDILLWKVGRTLKKNYNWSEAATIGSSGKSSVKTSLTMQSASETLALYNRHKLKELFCSCSYCK